MAGPELNTPTLFDHSEERRALIGRNIRKSGPKSGAPSNRNSKRILRKRKRNRFRKASGTNLLGNSEKRHAAHLKRQKPSRFTEPETNSNPAPAPK